jgi:RimJ/RimL family protein N-acetyltransferase
VSTYEHPKDPTALLVGERVKICAVREADFAPWAAWFNSERITSFLDQGEFPNSEADQRQFFANARAAGRFIGMVRSIATDALLGGMSLSEIELEFAPCLGQFGVGGQLVGLDPILGRLGD